MERASVTECVCKVLSTRHIWGWVVHITGIDELVKLRNQDLLHHDRIFGLLPVPLGATAFRNHFSAFLITSPGPEVVLVLKPFSNHLEGTYALLLYFRAMRRAPDAIQASGSRGEAAEG
jgi:hypothetical protein